MRPTTHTQVPPILMKQASPAWNNSALSNSILHCAESLVSRNAAILVLGKTAQLVNPHALPTDVLQELQAKLETDPALFNTSASQRRLLSQPAVSEGSFICALPLVHSGSLESILYLHGTAAEDQEGFRQKLGALNSLCDVAAEAIAHHRTGEGAVLPTTINDSDDSNQLLPLMSSQLMSVIAHDIRSPITVIRGYLKMILSGRTGPVTVEQSECLEAAMSSMNQLTSLAGLIGGTAGFMEQIHAEDLSLQDDLWRTSWREVELQAQEKALVLREVLPDSPVMVCGDRRILRDVIRQLIIRAIALAGLNTDVIVEISGRKTGEVALKILFSGSTVERGGEEVVSELLPLVFLHGGKLTFRTTNENRSTFTLILPGKDA